jgi:hypothetical protein
MLLLCQRGAIWDINPGARFVTFHDLDAHQDVNVVAFKGNIRQFQGKGLPPITFVWGSEERAIR